MSKTCILCHIVFSTKMRKSKIPTLSKQKLYAYIAGILKKKKCFIHALNGMPDHIHILLDLNPTEPLSEIVRTIKQSSSSWINENRESFPWFNGWGKGYFAASVSPNAKNACKEYISNQELHHGGKGFLNELQYLIERIGLKWFEDEWN